MPSYLLNATAVPAVQVPAALLNPSVDSPTTYQAIIAGDTTVGLTKHNANCVRSDNLGRYGGGGRAVAAGLELTAGSGLTLNYSAGVILADGSVYKAGSTLAMTDASQNYVWISQGGTVAAVVGSTTPPAGTQVYLGRVTTAGGVITDIDYSGRVELKGGYLWRKTADAGVPGDTPPAGVKFWHQTAGALYFWDGTAYQGVPPIAASYVVIGAHNALTAERILTAGDGLALTDGGAGGAATLAVNVDNTGIEINADTLRLKDLGVTTGKLAAAAVTEAKLGFEPVRDPGRSATGHVRLAAQPVDGDTVTVTVAGVAVTYEFDSGGGVGGGRVAVTIGVDEAATTTNLRTAINAQQGGVLASAVHGTDNRTVDLAVLTRGSTFSLAESTAGVRLVVQDNAEELTAADRYLFPLARTVTAEDVTRGRVRIDTRLTAITTYLFRLRTSATNNAEVAYNGTLTVTGGVIELDDDGATDLAAGNVIDLIVVGT